MLLPILLPALLAATLPHHEQLAPSVYAAGFSDKYKSANCGWIVNSGSTLLIDVPRGVDVPAFLNEVRTRTGKPVSSVMLTDTRLQSTSEFSALQKAGVKLVTTAEGVQPIPYPQGVALWLGDKKVLFAGPASINGPRAVLPGNDTAQWIQTLTKLEKLGARSVVPGQGSWGDAQVLTRLRRYLEEFRRQVAYHIAMGRPLSFIEADVKLPSDYYVWMPYDEPRPEDTRHVYSELTVPQAPFATQSLQSGKMHALVLIGDRFHEPEHLRQGLEPVFQATGVNPHFTVDVRALNAETLGKVQLLVILRDGMNWPEGPSKPNLIWMTPEQEKAVVDFAERGGAFLNLHNSMGVYPKDGPFLNLVGGRYIGHGPLERFRVEIIDPNHPITKGVKPFFAADEQHTPPNDAKVHVLLRNVNDDGSAVASAGWVYEPGKGRLVHLASGHTREALLHPEYQKLMRNAVQWLMRK